MKLLYDHQVFTLQRYGGISRYFYELIVDILEKDQIDISLFMGHFINEFGLEKYKDKYKKFFGKTHKDYPKSKLFYLHFNNILFRRFFKNTYPDIYHQTYYQYLNKDFKGKRIITVYDMTHELFPKLFSPLDRTSEWKKTSIPKADGITCISKSTKNDLLKMFDIAHENVEVIYLGFACINEFEKKRKIDSPYILFVGDRGGHKNFNLLLECLSIKNNLRKNFKLICFGRNDFTNEESEKIRKYNLENSVEYISGPDTLLANLYYNASAFVYPSKYEGFGIPPLEAMNYGCPVVASYSSSIPEVVGDAGFYFDPENSEELGEKLDQVISNDDLRKELIKKGYEQKEKFSWERCSEETLKFYEKVLNS
jgi:glycosyltransferase involved in cell wall biosynthesis